MRASDGALAKPKPRPTEIRFHVGASEMQLRSHQKHEIVGLILYWESFTARPAQILQLANDGFACPWLWTIVR